MPKQRIVTLDGATFTDILASTVVHYLKVYEEGARVAQLIYKRKDDDFTEIYSAAPGDMIEIVGHGRSGLIGRPPNYNGSGHPTTGDIILKVKAADDSPINVVVYESENEL